MEVLQIKNLSFSYPESEKKALRNINLSVNEGEFIVVFGKSGCGKSTLLKLIKPEISPFGEKSGDIFYCGTPLDKINNKISASEIGFISQNPESQIVTDEVWHELAFGLESLGLDTKEIRSRVAEMAGYFGIESWFHKKTNELSGGQKQLLNLASVMAMQPKMLLLDEPTAQLDPIAAANFISTLHKLNRELGLTVVLIEHRLEEALPIADKLLFIDEGASEYFDVPQNITQYFKSSTSSEMECALPCATRIFSLLNGSGESPLTVRDGRNYITRNYGNKIDEITVPQYTHSNVKCVELKDVYFRYDRELPDVLKGMSLSVYKGEHFCILGGNGAGKTTALQIIAGLLKAYRGKIKINNKKLSSYSQNELYIENIALLPQNPQTVFLEKTVYDDLSEVCKSMKSDEKDISYVVNLLKISHLLSQHPYDLSGGEQQKAALAKMLLLKPKILLLDEPTKGIDAHSKKSLCEILNKLKQNGMTIITVTHDVEFASSVCDRVGLCFDGKLTSIDAPNNFFSKNSFYTTSASRISRGYFKNTITAEQVVSLCVLNGKGGDCNAKE